MKRKEAIEKIKKLWPKDAIFATNEKDAMRLCYLMHESWLKRNSQESLKEETHRTEGISIIYYGMDGSDWDVYYRNNFDKIDCFNFIHQASDFLGREKEEESLVDNTDEAEQQEDDKLAEEINEWLERLYWVNAKNTHTETEDVKHTINDNQQSINIVMGKCIVCKNINTLENWSGVCNVCKYWTSEKPLMIETNLHSTVNQMWETVSQEIHFVCWSVRTIENVDTSLIEQSMFTTLITDKLPRDINTENVAYIRIKAESNNTRPWNPTPLIFHLKNDYKVTVKDIIPSTRKVGEFIKYRCSNGDMVLIKNNHLNAIEGDK